MFSYTQYKDVKFQNDDEKFIFYNVTKMAIIFVYVCFYSRRVYPHLSPHEKKMICESEMTPEMNEHVFDCFKRATECATLYNMAKYIAEEFDEEHGGKWNCLVAHEGEVSAYVMSEHNCFIDLMNFEHENLSHLVQMYLWR